METVNSTNALRAICTIKRSLLCVCVVVAQYLMDNYMTITARTKHPKGGTKSTLVTLLHNELKGVNLSLKSQPDLDTLRNIAQDRQAWTAIRERIMQYHEQNEAQEYRRKKYIANFKAHAREYRERRLNARNIILFPAKIQRTQPPPQPRAPKRVGIRNDDIEENERPRKRIRIRLLMPEEQEPNAMDTS